jgi:DNA primase
MLLQRLSNRVVLALDADRAGIAAVKRAADIMLHRGLDIKVANMVGGKDPADLIREDVQKFRKIIGTAKPIIEYLLDIIEADKKDERNFKLRVREEVLPVLIKISNKIDQEHFEGVIAERLATTKEAIHFETQRLQELQKEKGTHDPAAPKPNVATVQFEEKNAVELIRKKEELIRYLAVLASVVTENKKEVLKKAFFEIVSEEAEQVEERIGVEQKSGLSFTLESYLTDAPPKQVVEDIADKLNELSALIAHDRIVELQEKLAVAETAGDDEAVLECLKGITDIQKQRTEKRYTTEMFA